MAQGTSRKEGQKHSKTQSTRYHQVCFETVFPRNDYINRSCYWSWRYITATEIQSRRCIFCWLSTLSRKDLWLWWHLHNQAVKLYLQFSLPVTILTSMPPGMWQGHRWASSIKTWMAEGSGCSILCEIEKCNWGPWDDRVGEEEASRAIFYRASSAPSTVTNNCPF